MKWTTDRALQGRIGLALLLVLVLPFAFAYTMLFAMNTVGIELLRWTTDDPWNGGFYVHPLVVVGLVIVGFAAQYWLSERAALRSIGARRVDASEYPDVHAAVSRLATQADLPMPDVAVAETDVPNAFAIGRSVERATIVVTTGLLDRLDADQRDAVLAHEVAHVKNRDVAVMTFSYFLPTLTYGVAMVAYAVLGGVFRFLGDVHYVDEDSAKPLFVAIVVLTVSAAVTFAVSAVFWVGSFLLFRVLSRYREFAADRGAVALTGDPMALANALYVLDGTMADAPDTDLRAADGGLEAMYVLPVDSPQFGSNHGLLSTDLFPATHPPLWDRLDELRAMNRDLETA